MDRDEKEPGRPAPAPIGHLICDEVQAPALVGRRGRLDRRRSPLARFAHAAAANRWILFFIKLTGHPSLFLICS